MVLRPLAVTVLDPVTIMEQRLSAFGFDPKLMSRLYLGGEALRELTAIAS